MAHHFKNRQHSLLPYLNAARSNHHFVDVELQCLNNVRVFAHMFVLTTASEFLRELLERHQNEPKVHIILPFHAKIVRLLMNFIYCGEVTVQAHESKEFIELTKQFHMTLRSEALSITKTDSGSQLDSLAEDSEHRGIKRKAEELERNSPSPVEKQRKVKIEPREASVLILPPCKFCSKVFKRIGELLAHLSSVHFKKEYQQEHQKTMGRCSRCPNLPEMRSDLAFGLHVGAKHQGVLQYLNEDYKSLLKKFTDPAGDNNGKTAAGTLSCKDCGKQFKSNYLVIQHLTRTHYRKNLGALFTERKGKCPKCANQWSGAGAKKNFIEHVGISEKCVLDYVSPAIKAALENAENVKVRPQSSGPKDNMVSSPAISAPPPSAFLPSPSVETPNPNPKDPREERSATPRHKQDQSMKAPSSVETPDRSTLTTDKEEHRPERSATPRAKHMIPLANISLPCIKCKDRYTDIAKLRDHLVHNHFLYPLDDIFDNSSGICPRCPEEETCLFEDKWEFREHLNQMHDIIKDYVPEEYARQLQC